MKDLEATILQVDIYPSPRLEAGGSGLQWKLTAEQRTAIARAAKTWLGTPYHHRAAVKGAGADCAMFPLAVYRECGLIPASYHPPEYSSQWHLHRSEELYLAELEKFAIEGFAEPEPADFVVFKFGRTFSHGAIVIGWPMVIHSYIPHGVTLADAMRDGQLVGREMKVYRISDSLFSEIPTAGRDPYHDDGLKESHIQDDMDPSPRKERGDSGLRKKC